MDGGQFAHHHVWWHTLMELIVRVSRPFTSVRLVIANWHVAPYLCSWNCSNQCVSKLHRFENGSCTFFFWWFSCATCINLWEWSFTHVCILYMKSHWTADLKSRWSRSISKPRSLWSRASEAPVSDSPTCDIEVFTSKRQPPLWPEPLSILPNL